MEGRESTRRTLPESEALIETHAFAWEIISMHLERQWCVIEGCDRRIAPDSEGGLIGRVVDRRIQDEEHLPFRIVGWACQRHTSSILSAIQDGTSGDTEG